ncbi:polysaccharide biosynthesis protein [Oceaniglobus ichthyenteri]|uniref:polysaccharide biosynthesis protein n=1 Tax=Oceaniglobus ichthyenteri TaxID=2136177 RepID=UPI000D36C1D4|nr:nucleoside-diphosphate sugar epimerase/dehydratase [Oceaniglobus ichthyenteri]
MQELIRYFTSLSRQKKRAILLGVDVALVPLAYGFTLLVQQEAPADYLSFGPGPLVLALLMVVAAAISTLMKIPNIRLKSYDISGMGRIAAMSGALAVVSAALHQVAGTGLAAGSYVMFGIVYFLIAAASRVVLLEVLSAMYRRINPRCRVLIYGAGTTGTQLVQALSAHETIEAVAFVDDNTALQGLTISGLPVMRPTEISRIVKEKQVDRVLLAMPSQSHPKQMQIARRLEKSGLEVQALPSFAQLIGEEKTLVEKLVPIMPSQFLGRKAFDRSLDFGCSHIVGRSVMVSGGGGSIGSELCRQVLGCKPAKLVVFDLSEIALYEAERSLRLLASEVGAELVTILGSVTEARLVRRALQDHKVDLVLHAAAYKHVPMVEQNPLVGLANNVLGTWTLGREAREAGVERFVLISSDKAVRPTNVMGASKRLAEFVVQDLAERSPHTVFTMVRFGNVLGSSGSVVPLFQEQILRGGPVTVTHRDVTRFFMTVEEAVSLVLMAGSFARGGEVFVLDMGKTRRIWDMARQVIEDAGYTVRDENNPDGDIEIKDIGLRPGEKLHEELLIGEGHVTTAHEKIFAAHEAKLSEIEVASAIRSLREALATGNEKAALAVAERFVEGYHPAMALAAGNAN